MKIEITLNRLVVLLIILFLILPISALFLKKYFSNESTQVQVLENLFKPLDLAYIYLAFMPNRLPVYEITTTNADLEKLYDSLPKTKEAADQYEKRFLENRVYIPATITTDNNQYYTKLSVRGTSPQHYLGEKKSLRVRLQKGQEASFEGLDFLIPEMRHFIDPIISNSLSKRLGLYEFKANWAWVRLNGKNMGIYMTLPDEEDNSNLELGKFSPNDILYREDLGPQIIAQGNNWSDLFAEGSGWQIRNKPDDNDHAPFSAIEKFKEIDKLNGRDFYNKIGDILDVDEYLGYAAHNTLIGDWHQEDFHNLNAIYLKEKGQLWFMPGDTSTNPVSVLLGRHFSNFREKMLLNPQNFWKRNKIMWEIINDESYKKSLSDLLASQYNLIKAPIYQDPTKPFRFLAFKMEVSNLQKIIFENFSNIKDYFIPYRIDSYITDNSDQNKSNIARIKILVNSYFQPNLNEIKFNLKEPAITKLMIYYDENENGEIDPGEEMIGQIEINNTNYGQVKINQSLKAGRFTDSPIDKIRPTAISQLLVKSPVDISIQNVELTFTNSLTGQNLDSINYMLNGSFFVDKPSPPSFIKQLSKSKFEIGPGTFNVDEDIFIPTGELEIKPGTIIKVAPKKSIISYAKVVAQGSENLPITITAKDKTQNWGSFLVINAPDKSVMNYVNIEYGSGINNYGITATGSLSMHYSDLIFDHGKVSHAGDDDGINVKHAYAKITNSVFENNRSDHIDLDVVEGEVTSNHFDNSAATDENSDGLDVSFSKLEIKNNYIYKSPDKCISIGEDSDLNIHDNILDSCNYGVAVKDGSKANIINNTIKNNNIGIGTYRKKAIYEVGGAAFYKDIIFENNKQDVKSEEYSQINEL